jgi:hypothetical protein
MIFAILQRIARQRKPLSAHVRRVPRSRCFAATFDKKAPGNAGAQFVGKSEKSDQ